MKKKVMESEKYLNRNWVNSTGLTSLDLRNSESVKLRGFTRRKTIGIRSQVESRQIMWLRPEPLGLWENWCSEPGGHLLPQGSAF